jgi:hypothetical protein
MPAHPVNIVTVCHELGAGGSEFARELGIDLGWPVLDHQIVHRVADRLRTVKHTDKHTDKHPHVLLAKIAAVLTAPCPELGAFPPSSTAVISDAIASATTAVIEEAGTSQPLIVVGHGAQCIFGGRPDALHVRLTASADARIERVATRMGIDPARAANLVRRTDHDRQAYVHRYFHRDWRSARLYDLQINTTEIAVGESAWLVAGLVWSRSLDAGAGVAPLPALDPIQMAG